MPTSDTRLDEPQPGAPATLAMLANAAVRRAQMSISCAMPAEVVSYSPPLAAGSESKPALVTVKPHFKYARVINQEADLNPGEELDDSQERSLYAVGDLPDVPNVPVLYVGGSTMQVRSRLTPGEVGLLIVCDRSLDDWIQTGGPVDPVFTHTHAIADGVFIPGLRYGTNAQSVGDGYSFIGEEGERAGMYILDQTRDLEISTDGQTLALDAASLISIGANAADFVALAAKVDQIITTLDTVFRVGWITVPNDGGAALKAAYLAAFPSAPNSVAATKVQAE